MDNKFLCIMAGYDDETEKIIADKQTKLYEQGFSGVQTKDIPMHFTLGSYSLDREAELIGRLDKIEEEYKAFDVSFNHIGLFRNPGNDVLFMAPEVSREMLGLKDYFLDSEDKFKWAAHTTLLIDKPDVIAEALQIVLNDLSPIEGKVEYIYLYEFWPTRHIKTIKLKG